jgi:hypothetical protein
MARGPLVERTMYINAIHLRPETRRDIGRMMSDPEGRARLHGCGVKVFPNNGYDTYYISLDGLQRGAPSEVWDIDRLARSLGCNHVIIADNYPPTDHLPTYGWPMTNRDRDLAHLRGLKNEALRSPFDTDEAFRNLMRDAFPYKPLPKE